LFPEGSIGKIFSVHFLIFAKTQDGFSLLTTIAQRIAGRSDAAIAGTPDGKRGLNAVGALRGKGMAAVSRSVA
jgi:hypothetical protein